MDMEKIMEEFNKLLPILEKTYKGKEIISFIQKLILEIMQMRGE